MNRAFPFLLVLAGLFVAGCATAGKDFDETQISRIKDGETTRAEVIEIFGQPNQTDSFTKTETGAVKRFIYSWAHSSWGGSSTKSKALAIDFDENDVVVEHAYTAQDM